MVARCPLVVVVAGHNGAGKSTTAQQLLQGALAVQEFVNADTIAAGLSGFRPESAAISAGRVMLERIKTLADLHVDFAFETTLASRSFAPWLRTLRGSDHRTHLAFLSLPSADLAVARVAERVLSGGHAVPEDVVRRRFKAGLANFFTLYQPVFDSWQVFDNSVAARPRLVASRDGADAPVVLDEQAWATLLRGGRS